MRRHRSQGFTLLEILTVIVIILIIAGWVISASGSAQQKAARARAQTEIKAISTGCENYKADNGVYPRSTDPTKGTNAIDPKKDGNPTSPVYYTAALDLYKMLSGDTDANGKISSTEAGVLSKAYFTFNNNMWGGSKDTKGNVTAITFIKDPFGYSYGYSTAGAAAEETYLSTTGGTRPASPPGYNSTFDIWCTGGQVATASPTDADRAKWLTNW